MNILPEQVLQIQQLTVPDADDQQSSIQYDQASLQWTEEAASQQKENVHSVGNALQSITSRLNEPLHIELMTDGLMLPSGEQENKHIVATNGSEVLAPPHPRVCVFFGMSYRNEYFIDASRIV